MSGERFTLDTNVLIYSIDSQAGEKRRIACEVIGLARQRDCWLTLQAVDEFYAACVRRGRMPAVDAAAQAADWLEMFPCLPSSPTAVRAALAEAARGRASYWDALLLATAAEGGCTVILSEDMADGVVTGGVRVISPFGDSGIAGAALGMLAADT